MCVCVYTRIYTCTCVCRDIARHLFKGFHIAHAQLTLELFFFRTMPRSHEQQISRNFTQLRAMQTAENKASHETLMSSYIHVDPAYPRSFGCYLRTLRSYILACTLSCILLIKVTWLFFPEKGGFWAT